MANGGKSESQPLIKFSAELEHQLCATTEQIKILKNCIFEAKRVLNLSAESVFVSETKRDIGVENIQNETPKALSDVECSLEEDIERILKVAEKVRNKAESRQIQKSRISQPVQIKKPVLKKEQAFDICKSKENEVSRRGIQSKTASSRTKPAISNLKTTYRQDFCPNKGKNVQYLTKESKQGERKSTDPKLGKTNVLPEVNQKSVKKLGRGLADKNIIGKRKAVPFSGSKNKFTTEEDGFADSPKFSAFHDEINSNKLSLSEVILKKTEIPNYRELLEVIRRCHGLLSESKGKIQKEENKLKENFLKKCAALNIRSENPDNELESIFKKFLPYCAWAAELERSFFPADLNGLKEAMQEEEGNIEKIIFSHQKEEMHAEDHLFSSDIPSNTSYFREFSLWNPSAVLPIFKELDGIPYLHYKNVQEWISFQNSLHELQECQLQLKIFHHIHHIITYYFNYQESPRDEALEHVINNEDSLALFLKSMAAITDFSGHLRMPILACVNKINTT